MKCGLMDQFIAVFGRRNSALFLDCETLAYEHFPVNLKKDNLGILVYDTKVRRKLAGSEYNSRREEAARALEILRAHGAVSYKEATLVRARENQAGHVRRSLQAGEARHQRERPRPAFGQSPQGRQLLRPWGRCFSSPTRASGTITKCPAPSSMSCTRPAGRFLGCLGARLVGAGFGGSGIAIVEKSRLAAFEDKLRAAAQDRGFPEPECRVISIGEGALAERLPDRPGR